MSTETRRESRLFITGKESVAGTPETTCLFEATGVMNKPKPSYQIETDKGKLGADQHGTTADLQAAWVEWSYTGDRIDELGYFASFAYGAADAISSPDTGVYSHMHNPLSAAFRTLPTFTMEFGNGTTNAVYAHNIVNEIAVTTAAGGTGLSSFTVTGFGNAHSVENGVFTLLATGSMSSGTENVKASPLLNHRCFQVWEGVGVDTIDETTVDYTTNNLAASVVELTTMFSGINYSFSNGISADMLAVAGGCGILNYQERSDPAISLELILKKDTSKFDPDVKILLNTKNSLELNFTGYIVATTYKYATKFIFPQVQLLATPEGDDAPIENSITVDVQQTTADGAIMQFEQTAFTVGFNA